MHATAQEISGTAGESLSFFFSFPLSSFFFFSLFPFSSFPLFPFFFFSSFPASYFLFSLHAVLGFRLVRRWNQRHVNPGNTHAQPTPRPAIRPSLGRNRIGRHMWNRSAERPFLRRCSAPPHAIRGGRALARRACCLAPPWHCRVSCTLALFCSLDSTPTPPPPPTEIPISCIRVELLVLNARSLSFRLSISPPSRPQHRAAQHSTARHGIA